jgi:hypothetical protein
MNKLKIILPVGGLFIYGGLLLGLYLGVWIVFIVGWILFLGGMFYDICFIDDGIGL